jgi:SIT family siderophore-iron:H+ symporter-like MFS transporter
LPSEIIVADLSSLRNRVFVTFLLPLPFVINTWVSGDVAASVLSVTTWRWGVGMWAIIYPASTLPLVTVLILARRRAQRSTHYNQIIPAYRKKGFVRALASELDIIGLFLVSTSARGDRLRSPMLIEATLFPLAQLAAALLLILVPFTIAGGVSKSWGTAKIIAPLVLGFLMIPVFCLWEAKYASHPIIPASLLRDRTVICCFGIACLLNCSW